MVLLQRSTTSTAFADIFFYPFLQRSTPSTSIGFELDSDRPLKEQAIERILVRWQYAGLQYPSSASSSPSSSSSSSSLSDGADAAAAASASVASAAGVSAKDGFVEMPGFHGVFVGVREPMLGIVKDTRSFEPRPSAVSSP